MDKLLSQLEAAKHSLCVKMDECVLKFSSGSKNPNVGVDIYFTTAVCIRDRVYYDKFPLKNQTVNFPAPAHVIALSDDEKSHLAVILKAVSKDGVTIPSHEFAYVLQGCKVLLQSDDDELNNTSYTVV